MERSYSPHFVMRIGLVSDVHRMPTAPVSPAAWHGAGEFAGALDRLRLALAQFGAREVDLVVVAGDLAHRGDIDSLVQVLHACASSAAPVLVVAGNHDVAGDERRLERAHAKRRLERGQDGAAPGYVSLASSDGEIHGGVRVAGVHVGQTHGWFGAHLRELPRPERWGLDPVVLVSHYPALSLATVVSERGFPYPGDLIDRRTLAGLLAARYAPTVVVGGHVHARAALSEGPVLQLTTGALVEPPYEAAVVDIGFSPALTVRRECVRLFDHTAAREPVFSPDREAWRFEGMRWIADTQVPMTATPANGVPGGPQRGEQ